MTQPRMTLSAELMALSAQVSEDIATGPSALRMLAIAKLEPMLHDTYAFMYQQRGWHTTDDVMREIVCSQRRAAQLTSELYTLGLLARETRVVGGRKRFCWKAR